jgi:hypothetical protein
MRPLPHPNDHGTVFTYLLFAIITNNTLPGHNVCDINVHLMCQ